MKSCLSSIILIFFTIISTSVLSQEMKRIDLDGKWRFRMAGTNDWMDAKVPGCVHTDLMRNHIIPDPFTGDNEKNVQWISDIGWEYEKTFTISDTVFRSPYIELICEGLDTYANVYLNDSLILVADNMFREWNANVQPLLKIGVNHLRTEWITRNATGTFRTSA